MYEMLTGRVPFDSDTSVSVALKHMQEPPVPPMEVNNNIPKAVNDIILKAMQKEPMARYQTATEMLRDLARALKEPEGDFVEEDDFNDGLTRRMGVVTDDMVRNAEKNANKKKKKGTPNNNRPQQQVEGTNRPQQPQRENEGRPQPAENGNRGDRENRPRNNNNNRNRGQNQGRNNENRRPERRQERPQNQERPQGQERERPARPEPRPERYPNQAKPQNNEKPSQE